MDKKELAKYCRQVAEEGCVLLENDGTLPFYKEEKIAIFGREQFEYVKSGSGSGGLVNCEYVTDSYSSLCGKISIDTETEEFYRKFIQENPRIGVGEWSIPTVQKQPEVSEDFIRRAAERNDKALIVLSRSFGEGADAQNVRGEYLLTEQEENSIALICRYFEKVAVVINSGNVIDLSWIKSTASAQFCLRGKAGRKEVRRLLRFLSAENRCGKIAAKV